ncbi:hypothetical protein CHRYSEO8AT_590003 [Chryseobacterium sp. 8AT]|nr:hypothetical protein CHRYSEO8AT_590003 [Chryseobacterium sp. 8AT]
MEIIFTYKYSYFKSSQLKECEIYKSPSSSRIKNVTMLCLILYCKSFTTIDNQLLFNLVQAN